MITHDQLAHAIEMETGAIHAVDFRCAHDLGISGEQCADAWIFSWNSATIPKPDVKEMRQAYALKHFATFHDKEARDKRDYLLKQTDWTQGQDVAESTRAKWSGYRQALRDLPTSTGWPAAVVWPDPPA